MHLTVEEIIRVMARKKYKVFTGAQGRPYDLNIVGIRLKERKAGKFDDLICCFFKRDDGEWNFYIWPATTDPGAYWLNKLGRKDGTAILKPGQYRGAYQLGLHRGEYTALKQVKPVTVYRDANRDATLDMEGVKETTGYFGINIHRARKTGTTVEVGPYSAGCQVLANAEDFKVLISLCQAAEKIWGPTFTYTLLEERNFDGF